MKHVNRQQTTANGHAVTRRSMCTFTKLSTSHRRVVAAASEEEARPLNSLEVTIKYMSLQQSTCCVERVLKQSAEMGSVQCIVVPLHLSVVYTCLASHVWPRRAGATAQCCDLQRGTICSSTGMDRHHFACRRKSREVEAQLLELGQEGLEDRLKSATETPVPIQYRLTNVISENVPRVG
jgi:hypothetical protein